MPIKTGKKFGSCNIGFITNEAALVAHDNIVAVTIIAFAKFAFPLALALDLPLGLGSGAESPPAAAG